LFRRSQVPLLSLVPTRMQVRVVKIDTEGAEVGILESLLTLVRRGKVDNIIVEIVPSWWESRGSTREDGLRALTELQTLATRTVLLDDGTPFTFAKKVHTLPEGIVGPAYVDFSIVALIENRVETSSGCNVWFQFRS
jgi:hypothetical protein